MPGLCTSESLFRAESKKLLSLKIETELFFQGRSEKTSSRRQAGFFLWAISKFRNDLICFDSA